MQVSGGYGQTRQIGGGCPHGGAPGACGICSGGGGGGGSKKNTSGLMSWNEAWATWNAIQLGKTRQADYLKAVNTSQQMLAEQTFAMTLRATVLAFMARAQAMLQPALQALGRVFSALSTPLKSAAQLLSQLGNAVRAGMQTLGEGVKNLLAQLSDVAAKLTMAVLGESFTRAREWVEKNLENLKKLIYDGLLKKLLRAVNLETLKEFTGQVIQRVTGWLFDKLGKKGKEDPARQPTLSFDEAV